MIEHQLTNNNQFKSKSLADKLKTNLPKIIVALVLIALLGSTVFFYMKYRDVKNNPQKTAQQANQDIINKVSKLIALPSDEAPTMATILDQDKLKDQPFFENAKNGDRILIYTQAKKAIIYRESENKIINVGPILLDNTQTQKK